MISQKIIFQSKYFKVNQIVVERNGKKFVKEIVERNPFVVVLALTPKNEVYLVSQYRDALQKTSLEVVAGLIEPGETPAHAAKRELQEETGLIAQTVTPLITGNVSPNMVNICNIFVATDLISGQTQQDDDEDIEVIKVPLSQAIKKIETGEISILSHVAALLLFDKLQKEGKV